MFCSCLGHCELGPPGTWATGNLGHRELGPLGTWATGNLGHRELEHLGTWATWELGPPRTVRINSNCTQCVSLSPFHKPLPPGPDPIGEKNRPRRRRVAAKSQLYPVFTLAQVHSGPSSQVAHVPSGPSSRWPKFPVAQLPRWPNFPVAQLRGGPTSRWPNFAVAQLPGGPKCRGPSSQGRLGPPLGWSRNHEARSFQSVPCDPWHNGKDAMICKMLLSINLLQYTQIGVLCTVLHVLQFAILDNCSSNCCSGLLICFWPTCQLFCRTLLCSFSNFCFG